MSTTRTLAGIPGQRAYENDSDCLKFLFTYKWLASAGATLPTTGFTRVLARPQGVFSQPRNAAKKSLAVQSLGAINSPAALSRDWVMLVCDAVVRSSHREKSGYRTDFEGPLLLITDFWKPNSSRRCLALGEVDQTPCSTSKSLLSNLGRLANNQPSRLHRRSLPVLSRIRPEKTDDERNRQLDSANLRSCFVALTPHAEVRAIALCEPSFDHDGPIGLSSATEQVWPSRTVSSLRTRNMQRVPYEEGNARQCAAARREPHCHC